MNGHDVMITTNLIREYLTTKHEPKHSPFMDVGTFDRWLKSVKVEGWDDGSIRSEHLQQLVKRINSVNYKHLVVSGDIWETARRVRHAAVDAVLKSRRTTIDTERTRA